ncbi:MAG: phytanoyl-CoA dioxygenase family protein [Gammaproteobacteria bacterium]|jgi:ectoine hydroxylase-related dioxygenase (phytanoyl-CoA dioxygenase family)|nr:phytanoyl-CoA dioxygenase family protein [Gammaproteobacteria bacterium]
MSDVRLPPLTRDWDRALADLREHGLCLVADALPSDMLGRARDALYRAVEDDACAGRRSAGFTLDRDAGNRRVWNLLNRDPLFAALAEHPLALHLVQATLGWPALLSNISGNIVGPGATAGVLHADQVFVPQPWPKRPQGLNVAWCIDDFTRDNGATEVLPGSHLLARNPRGDDDVRDLVPIEAPAGTALIFESRLWHRTGANTSRDAWRAAVFPFYTTPTYRTQENWFLSLAPEVVDAASDTLLTLLAYKTEHFGLVYGESPR